MKTKTTTKTTGIKLTGILILLVLSIACLAAVRAVPQAPEQYWGYVVAEGMIIPSGTKLIVESNETGEVFIEQILPFDESFPGSYLFNIPFDDPATQEDEGAVPDEKLVFRVDSEYAISPEPGEDKAEPGKVNNNFTIKGTLDPVLSTSLSYSDDEPYINDEMKIMLSLENSGLGTALVKVTKFSEEGLQVLTGLPKSLEIAKNSSEILEVDAKPVECKDYSQSWKIEYYNLAGTKIDEITEKVRFTAKGQDIVLEDITVSEEEIIEGELIDIEIEVSNKGDFNISAYTLEIYDNDDLVRTVDIDEDIEIGDSAKKEYSLNLSVGEHEIKVSAELDDDECNSVNNDGKADEITVKKKIDKNAVAVNKTGDEILAGISFDLKLLNQTLRQNTLNISFVDEDTNNLITELLEYRVTVEDVLESGMETQEKNSTLLMIRQKLKALEEKFIQSISQAGVKQYKVNSSFADYVSENPGNFSSAEDIVALYNISNITVHVHLIELEYFSHEKEYLTRFNVVVGSAAPKESFALVAEIPKLIAGKASELVYETEHEVLMDDPVVSWASQQSIIFYANKDVFGNAEKVSYALVPLESARESVPLIQGFAVKEIEEQKKGIEWNWSLVFTMLLIVFVLSVLIYRGRSIHISLGRKTERQKLNSSFSSKPKPKLRQKIIIKRRIGEKQKSGIPAGKPRQKEVRQERQEAAPEAKPKAKKKLTIRELYRRMEAIEKGEALHLPEEKEEKPEKVQEQPRPEPEVRRPSPVPKAKHAIAPGQKPKPVIRRPVIKIRRYKPISMEELRRDDDEEPQQPPKPEQKPEMKEEPKVAEENPAPAEEKDEIEELDSKLNEAGELRDTEVEFKTEEISGEEEVSEPVEEKTKQSKPKKQRRVHKLTGAIKKKIGAGKHRKEMLEKIKQNFDNSYNHDLEYDHSRMAELKKFPEPKRRIHAIAERIKKTSTRDKESIAAAKEELRAQAKKKRYEVLLEKMKKAREAKKQKKQLEKEAKTEKVAEGKANEKTVEENKLQKQNDAKSKTQKKTGAKGKRRYQALLDKLKKKNNSSSEKNAPKKPSSTAKKGKRRYQVLLEKIKGKKEAKKAGDKKQDKK